MTSEEEPKKKMTTVEYFDMQTDPDFLNQNIGGNFNLAKKLSDFIGFITRTTFLAVAGSYFTLNAAKQESSFYMVTYLVCGVAAWAFSGRLVGVITMLAFDYGLSHAGKEAGVIKKSLVVSVAAAFTIFLWMGVYSLGHAVAQSNALNGGP